MTEKFDKEMQVNFICVMLIICCIVEMFLIIMRYTIVDSVKYGGNGLIITLLSSFITVLVMAVTYSIIKGSKLAWWFLVLSNLFYLPISIVNACKDPIFCLELIGGSLYVILLMIPVVREHCDIHFRRPQKDDE